MCRWYHLEGSHASTCPGWWCAYLIFDAICCQEKNQTYREWPFGVHCTLYMYIYGNTPPLALGKSFVGPPGARGYISQYIPPLGSVRIDYLFIWNMKMFFIGMRRGLIWVKLGEFQKICWHKNITNIRYVVGTISVCDVGGR